MKIATQFDAFSVATLIPKVSALLLVVSLSGCVSVVDVNESFRRIDRMWALENQRTEDLYRYRMVDATYLPVLEATRKAFLELGMPIELHDSAAGRIVARNNAPSPLSTEEWRVVVQAEAAKVKEVGGWYMVLNEDAKIYVVTVLAKVTAVGGKTLVVLDYELDSPKYRGMGFQPAKAAPPMAVQLASLKFWRALELELAKVSAPPPRPRSSTEKSV